MIRRTTFKVDVVINVVDMDDEQLVELGVMVAAELTARKEPNGNTRKTENGDAGIMGESFRTAKSTRTSTKSKKTLKGLVGIATLVVGSKFSFANSKRFYTVLGNEGKDQVAYEGMNGTYFAKNEVLVKAIAA